MADGGQPRETPTSQNPLFGLSTRRRKSRTYPITPLPSAVTEAIVQVNRGDWHSFEPHLRGWIDEFSQPSLQLSVLKKLMRQSA